MQPICYIYLFTNNLNLSLSISKMIMKKPLHFKKLLIQTVIYFKYIWKNNLFSSLCHSQNIASIFYHICDYTIIDSYRLVIFIYVSS